MPDMLVPLYRLPARSEGEDALAGQNIAVRRPNTFEFTPVIEFIKSEFSQGWADETAASFGRQPICSFIAIEDGKTIGFAAFDTTRRSFFGPTGVAVSHRGKGVGKALLIASLWGLADLGYAYGVIGAAGPVEFYQKTVGAIVIPDSVPGVYANLLNRE